MASNILEGGLLELENIKSKLKEMEKCLQEKKELESSEKQLRKDLTKKENEISDEIEKVIKKRRQQLEESFDENIDHAESKLKDDESNKGKKKKKAIQKRIEIETADCRKFEKSLKLDKKKLIKEQNIPSTLMNPLFFSIYFPQGLGDYLIIFFSMMIAFFLIPFGVYSLFLKGMGPLYLALCYLGVIIIFGGLFIIINKSKYKHLQGLKEVRSLNNRIGDFKRQEKKIKRKILKDKDESQYNLHEFDEKINSSNQMISSYLDKKKNALLEFDQITAEDIKKQIQVENQEALDTLKADYKKIKEKKEDLVKKCNDLSMDLSTNYESYLGKSFMTSEKLDAMASAIESGQAKDIGQAKIYITQNNES